MDFNGIDTAILIDEDNGFRLDKCREWTCEKTEWIIRRTKSESQTRILGSSVSKHIHDAFAFAYVQANGFSDFKVVYKFGNTSSSEIDIDTWSSIDQRWTNPIILRFDSFWRPIISYQKFSGTSNQLVIVRCSNHTFADDIVCNTVKIYDLQKPIVSIQHAPKTNSDSAYMTLTGEQVDILSFTSGYIPSTPQESPNTSPSLQPHPQTPESSPYYSPHEEEYEENPFGPQYEPEEEEMSPQNNFDPPSLQPIPPSPNPIQNYSPKSEVLDWKSEEYLVTVVRTTATRSGFQVSLDLWSDGVPIFAISYSDLNDNLGILKGYCAVPSCRTTGIVQGTFLSSITSSSSSKLDVLPQLTSSITFWANKSIKAMMMSQKRENQENQENQGKNQQEDQENQEKFQEIQEKFQEFQENNSSSFKNENRRLQSRDIYSNVTLEKDWRVIGLWPGSTFTLFVFQNYFSTSPFWSSSYSLNPPSSPQRAPRSTYAFITLVGFAHAVIGAVAIIFALGLFILRFQLARREPDLHFIGNVDTNSHAQLKVLNMYYTALKKD